MRLPQYRMWVSYIGTDFAGFQAQNNGDSIQGQLERVGKIILREDVRIRGASRTDAGVHAEGQVACIRTERPFDAWAWKRGFNALLPHSIGVSHIEPVDADFDPINASTGKVYRYRIWKGTATSPFYKNLVWSLYPWLDVTKMQAQAGAFVGTHDFSSFCNQGSDAKTKTRTIHAVRVIDRGPLIEVWVQGSGFLKQMVRIMVGTLTDIAYGKLPAGSLAQIIAARDRLAAGLTAPPDGLCLVKVFYDPMPDLDTVIRAAEDGFSIAVQ